MQMNGFVRFKLYRETFSSLKQLTRSPYNKQPLNNTQGFPMVASMIWHSVPVVNKHNPVHKRGCANSRAARLTLR